MDEIFLPFVIGLVVITVVVAVYSVKKTRSHKQKSEESMQELLNSVRSGLDKKEDK